MALCSCAWSGNEDILFCARISHRMNGSRHSWKFSSFEFNSCCFDCGISRCSGMYTSILTWDEGIGRFYRVDRVAHFAWGFAVCIMLSWSVVASHGKESVCLRGLEARSLEFYVTAAYCEAYFRHCQISHNWCMFFLNEHVLKLWSAQNWSHT